MILIATTSRDLTSDYIVLELQRRRAAYFRLNTEDISKARVRFRSAASNDWIVEFDNSALSLADVRAGYFRRPSSPAPPSLAVKDEAERAYCVGEWLAVLKSIYSALGTRWLNPPNAIMLAEDKPRQLALARSVGFCVPETLVTNDFDAASAFILEGDTIAKPLREALLESKDQERVIFTSRLSTLAEHQADAVAVAPMILQREIPKTYDVRVTTVGYRVFAAAIYSQEHAETEVDWRKGPHPDLRHEIIELPTDVEAACVRITRALDLRYSAIDLVLDRDGGYWFLEANPNGQWAWIENRTGLPIASAIVDELQEIAAR
jgi:glutathione synthase/RimK-type ligase-like ATP-grasp enzyme